MVPHLINEKRTTQIANEPPTLVDEPHKRIYVGFTVRCQTTNWSTLSKIHNLDDNILKLM